MAVAFSADGAVGSITLDKPPANSYDMAVIVELGAAIDEAAADAAARVVVVRSADERVQLMRLLLHACAFSRREVTRDAFDGSIANVPEPVRPHRR